VAVTRPTGPNYQQVGQNFSLGISGPTRLSEPLGVPKGNGGTVTLYDADGTRHIFKKAADGVTFSAPPGVHLHLRRFSDNDADKRWAMTRPDGITHFFDADGYQSTIEDRNGNVIRFTYEPLHNGNGSPQKRVIRVTDSSGVVDSPAAPKRSVVVRYGSDDRISQIEDHGGRKLRFAYDTRGFLRSLTEAAGTPVQRVTNFDYAGTGQNLDLASITDPRGNITRIAYDATGSKKRVARSPTAAATRRDLRTPIRRATALPARR
jgi:YD repeat-containing protein